MLDREYVASVFDIVEEELGAEIVPPFLPLEQELAMWRGSERPRKVSPLAALFLAHGGLVGSDAVGWLASFLQLTRQETMEVIEALYGGDRR